MSETAYAKINLALHVREKLETGYHRIETIFAFCEDGDELTGRAAPSLSLSLDGEFASTLAISNNLVARAAQALRDHCKERRGAALQLTKRLPVAAGLGGGSADAAAALRLLNDLWELELPSVTLEDIGRSLGADVPACIQSLTARGDGRGDDLSPVDDRLSGTPILLVNPRVELATADIFARWDGLDRGPLQSWKDGRNDLETAAIALVPQIGAILAWLSAQPGAGTVRMSGSGATCFALFETEEQRDRAAFGVPREWWHLPTRLR